MLATFYVDADRIDAAARLIEETVLASAARFPRTDGSRTAVGQQVDYIRAIAARSPTG